MGAIEVEGLRKTYGEVRAVDGLSFSVAPGEVFALLGPNGAGKTTTIEILEGHRDRDAGAVSVLGFDPQTGGRAYRERIGFVLQEAAVDEEFSIRELTRLYAGFFPAPLPVDEVIDLVGLVDKAERASGRCRAGGGAVPTWRCGRSGSTGIEHRRRGGHYRNHHAAGLRL